MYIYIYHRYTVYMLHILYINACVVYIYICIYIYIYIPGAGGMGVSPFSIHPLPPSYDGIMFPGVSPEECCNFRFVASHFCSTPRTKRTNRYLVAGMPDRPKTPPGPRPAQTPFTREMLPNAGLR